MRLGVRESIDRMVRVVDDEAIRGAPLPYLEARSPDSLEFLRGEICSISRESSSGYRRGGIPDREETAPQFPLCCRQRIEKQLDARGTISASQVHP